MSIIKIKKIAARVRQQNTIPICRCTQCIFQLFNMTSIPPEHSADKHRIAKAEKTIMFINCMLICIQDIILPGKCADKHNKRGFRQMKVCYKRLRHFEFISWIDKNISKAASGLYNSVFRSAFKRAAACCADADYSAAVCLCFIYNSGGFLAYTVILGMHFMLCDIAYLNGAKRAQSHMQREKGFLNAHFTNFFKQLLCEMQARRRRGGAARVP